MDVFVVVPLSVVLSFSSSLSLLFSSLLRRLLPAQEEDGRKEKRQNEQLKKDLEEEAK